MCASRTTEIAKGNKQMIELTLKEAAKAAGGKLVNCENIDAKTALVSSITLDSRKIERGSLFVAIKGERVDGHDYIKMAAEKGALCAISEQDVPYPHIRVKSSLAAMQGIAAHLREKSGVTVIAVVGSVGKTTTRAALQGAAARRARRGRSHAPRRAPRGAR